MLFHRRRRYNGKRNAMPLTGNLSGPVSYRNPIEVVRYEGCMTQDRSELLRGTLDMLILKTLALEPRHGLGISRRIEQITKGFLKVPAGSFFPALHRLEQRGWLR